MTTQATGIPSITAWKRLPPETAKFPSDVSCFFVWARIIHFELADVGLLNIIRTDIPRPQIGDPQYDHWAFLSLGVGRWLKNNVDNTVWDKLGYPSYADEVIKAIALLYPIRRNGTATETEDSERKIRNLPPKGMVPSVYARKWCNQTGQRSPNGNCMYCDGENHCARRCPYLNVEERPKKWAPSPDLWYLGMPYTHGLSRRLLDWACSNSPAVMSLESESDSETAIYTPEATDTASEYTIESTDSSSAPSIDSDGLLFSEGSILGSSTSDMSASGHSEHSDSGSEGSDSESSNYPDGFDSDSVYDDAPTPPRTSPLPSNSPL